MCCPVLDVERELQVNGLLSGFTRRISRPPMSNNVLLLLCDRYVLSEVWRVYVMVDNDDGTLACVCCKCERSRAAESRWCVIPRAEWVTRVRLFLRMTLQFLSWRGR